MENTHSGSATASGHARPSADGPEPAIRFGCVSCGKCCHDLRLTLSIVEAIDWLNRGGTVQILCDAVPDIDDKDQTALFRRRRSFTAQSGSMQIRVQVLLVAHFEGPCPNLLPDLQCGAYARRPNVCRIYPAEIVPGRTSDPAKKLCPPEAWADHMPALLRADGSVNDAETRLAINDARAAGQREAEAKRRLADVLGIRGAALGNEGYAIWTIEPGFLLSALHGSEKAFEPGQDTSDQDRGWTIVTERPQTAALIESVGALASAPDKAKGLGYLSLV